MFKCKECKNIMEREELEIKKGCFESDFGVSDLFDTRTSYETHICPHCGSEEVEEAMECTICNKYFLEEELDYNEVDKLCCENCRNEEL